MKSSQSSYISETLRFRSERGLNRGPKKAGIDATGSELLSLNENVTYVNQQTVSPEDAVSLLNDLGIEVSRSFLGRERAATESEVFGASFQFESGKTDVYAYAYMGRYHPFVETAVCAYGEKIDLRTLSQEKKGRRLQLLKSIIKHTSPLLVSLHEDHFKQVVQWLIDVADLDQAVLERLLPSAKENLLRAQKKETKGMIIFIAGSLGIGVLVWKWSWILGATVLSFGAIALLALLFG